MRRLILSCVVAVAFLLLGSAVSAQTPSNATIDNIFTSVNFTGVSTIFVEGQEIYANGFGFQDFHFTVPMTPRSRFRIASNTKLYTAIALWQLHERGLITMSDSIVSYLDPNDYAAFGVYGPYCPQYSGSNQCQPITFIDLLGMTSCIPNSVTGEVIPYAGSVAEYIGKYYISRELVCQPGGSTYYYSNAAFVWATYFIEKFTGMSYGEYIKRHITEPLGLHDTYYDGYNNEFGADWKRTEEYVQYLDPNTKELVNRGRCSTELDLGSINGAGGIISTVGDEATLWSKVFNFNSTTSPIFSNISTLYELVAPHVAIQQWNATHTQYYTQGLAVIAESTTQKIPNVILYEGGLLCSLTANLMFIPGASATASKTIVQAWTSSPSVFATEAQLQNVVAKQRGDAASIVSSFKRPYSDPATLAWAVADLLGFPETSTPKEHSRVRRA